jgi:hypothetical protein
MRRLAPAPAVDIYSQLSYYLRDIIHDTYTTPHIQTRAAGQYLTSAAAFKKAEHVLHYLTIAAIFKKADNSCQYLTSAATFKI